MLSSDPAKSWSKPQELSIVVFATAMHEDAAGTVRASSVWACATIRSARRLTEAGSASVRSTAMSKASVRTANAGTRPVARCMNCDMRIRVSKESVFLGRVSAAGRLD